MTTRRSSTVSDPGIVAEELDTSLFGNDFTATEYGMKYLEHLIKTQKKENRNYYTFTLPDNPNLDFILLNTYTQSKNNEGYKNTLQGYTNLNSIIEQLDYELNE